MSRLEYTCDINADWFPIASGLEQLKNSIVHSKQAIPSGRGKVISLSDGKSRLERHVLERGPLDRFIIPFRGESFDLYRDRFLDRHPRGIWKGLLTRCMQQRVITTQYQFKYDEHRLEIDAKVSASTCSILLTAQGEYTCRARWIAQRVPDYFGPRAMEQGVEQLLDYA